VNLSYFFVTHVQGMVYETDCTPQKNLIESGVADEFTKRAGDGTVTYESLSYPNIAWKGHFQEFKVACCLVIWIVYFACIFFFVFRISLFFRMIS
jgi:hypothetical protein